MNSQNTYLLGICIAVLAALAAFFVWKHETGSDLTYAIQQENAVASSTVPATPALTDTTNLYQNPAFHFSLAFPNTLAAREYNEAGGAISITFQSASSSQEFEVYVTPYADAQITPERFKLDEPSGVRDDPTDILIDGARGTMFFSRNPMMGETREVWIIHGGFLYEVVTERENDAWLASIMQTWRFI